jgi:hypothetical protein
VIKYFYSAHYLVRPFPPIFTRLAVAGLPFSFSPYPLPFSFTLILGNRSPQPEKIKMMQEIVEKLYFDKALLTTQVKQLPKGEEETGSSGGRSEKP